MKALVDASSLLSLEFMGVLDDALGAAEIYTTSTVEEELKEIAGFNDEKSRVAKRILALVQEGRLRIFDVQGAPYSKYLSGNALLALCVREKLPFLITDDADTAYYLGRMAVQKGVKLRMCAAVLMELVKSGRLSRPATKEKIEGLIAKRSWEGGILEVLARMYLEENVTW